MKHLRSKGGGEWQGLAAAPSMRQMAHFPLYWHSFRGEQSLPGKIPLGGFCFKFPSADYKFDREAGYYEMGREIKVSEICKIRG
jgi:hypothetical protein